MSQEQHTKKRKVDQENHQTDWTEEFCFILLDHANAKPTCLIAKILPSYKQSISTRNRSTSAQESATAASLQLSWTLTKAKKPFSDAKLIKEFIWDSLKFAELFQ